MNHAAGTKPPVTGSPRSLEEDRDAANRDEASLRAKRRRIRFHPAPPCRICVEESKATHDVIVFAADHVGGASIARANADDSDRRAAETKEKVDAIENDTQQAKDGPEAWILGLTVMSDESARVGLRWTGGSTPCPHSGSTERGRCCSCYRPTE